MAWMNKRILAVLLLGFYSGLPIALTGSTIQAWFSAEGLSLMTIGSLSLVGMPYLYKFFWAPVLDRYRLPLPGWLSKRKSWILYCQLLLSALMIVLAFQQPKVNVFFIVLIMFLIAIASATQDIAIDAFRTEILQPLERGVGAACVTFSYRLALLVSGGLGLVIAGEFGWQVLFIFLGLLMFAGAGITLLLVDVTEVTNKIYSLKEYMLLPIKGFLSRKASLLIIFFVLLYKFGDAFAQSLLTPFFLQELHFTLVELGTLYKIVGLASTITGAFLGGMLLPRLKMYKSLMLFGFLQGVSNLLFIILLYVGHSYAWAVFAIVFENLISGVTATIFVAFLMSLCDLRFTATQFALLSALASVGRVLVGPLAAAIVEIANWQWFFIASFILVIPSLFLLAMINKRVNVDSYEVDSIE